MRLRVAASAKINLGLEILGRRDDGFHEIVSVTQTISLADTLEAAPADRLAVQMTPPLVDESDNLVSRAAEVLAAQTDRAPGARLHVQKRVPLAAGLGGGSSDAAGALRLLNRLWDTGLSTRQLEPLAASLGSDVPLFLSGGASLIQGRGERVSKLPALRPCWLVLVCPPFSPPDKTRALYRALQPSEWTDGARTLALAALLRAGQAIDDAALVNTFDGPAARVYPGFLELRGRLQERTGRPFHLTGAGPSLFAIFTSAPEARAAAMRLQADGLPVHIARPTSRLPAIRASVC